MLRGEAVKAGETVQAIEITELISIDLQGNRPPKAKNRQIRLL